MGARITQPSEYEKLNKLIAGLLIGDAGTLAVVAASGYLVIANGLVPARGDQPPEAFEKWAARTSLKATIKREATEEPSITADPANLLAGVKIYGSNCSGCHGAPANPTPEFANGFYPRPPLFGNGDDVTDDPVGHTYWFVKHGIKFTSMPSFNKMLSEKEMWQVSLLLKNQNNLPAQVKDAWDKTK